MAKHRVEYAKTSSGDIVIAAIQDFDKSHYIKGIKLAVEEINHDRGGLLGRPLKLLVEQGSKDFKSAKSTIRRIVANPKVSVVMGHNNSRTAIPASFIYEKSKVLFFPPYTTNEELTSHGFSYTFRMLPDNKHMAEQISKTAETLSYKNMASLYARAKPHREFNFLLENAATEKGLKLIYSRSFFSENVDFRPLLSDLKKENVDAIFLSAETSTAVKLIKQVREMGIDTPILGPLNFNSQEFTSSVGMAGNKTIAPTLYNKLANNKLNLKFITSYRKEYNELPDADAAQGYDSVMLFSNKVEKTQSTLPALLTSIVRFSQPWTGVTGTHHFSKKGNMLGKKYFFQVLNNNKWHKLPTISPFSLKQIKDTSTKFGYN